jgi:hypothetical protein
MTLMGDTMSRLDMLRCNRTGRPSISSGPTASRSIQIYQRHIQPNLSMARIMMRTSQIPVCLRLEKCQIAERAMGEARAVTATCDITKTITWLIFQVCHLIPSMAHTHHEGHLGMIQILEVIHHIQRLDLATLHQRETTQGMVSPHTRLPIVSTLHHTGRWNTRRNR